MHVLRVVRVLPPVLIVAAVVAAASSVLSARPDLQKAKSNVDASWKALAPQLDHRYVLLTAVDDKLDAIPGPLHTLVADVVGAVTHWQDVRAHGAMASQVEAANNIEALARELVATAAASPRVQDNAAVSLLLTQFLNDTSRTAAGGFNRNVTSYEHERRGPVRTVVASLLGDATIPVLDTTPTTPGTPA
jgi:hypothetical protein